jgi:nitrous oxidase accessory protein NosD
MRKVSIALGAAASLLAFGATAGAAQASTTGHHAHSTEYVSPSGATGGADTSCTTAAYSTIGAAVAAASPGGTVVVCAGTYHEQVVVTKPLHLYGVPGAVINPKGLPALTIGTTKLPGSIGIGILGTSGGRVSGFKVIDAGFDAILVAASSHVSVSHNVLLHNGDVGVDINGSSWSSATRNYSAHNAGGGFLVADDIGANSHNIVGWNVATRNPGGCGVIIAGHSTDGVTDNLVIGNWLSYNGTLKSSGGGAGVVIASEVPGETVAGNTVAGNHIWGNGLAGVTLHAHLPGQNFNGNKVTGNWIGRNNLLGDPIDLVTSPTSTKNVAVPDTRTTGILAATASVVPTTVIARNHIYDNHFGIFLEALSNVVKGTHVYGLGSNHFFQVHKPVKTVIVPVP